MSLDHEFYEMQSALAATGQLRDEEIAALERHAAACPACAECMRDMAEISRDVFVAQAMRMQRRRAPARMQERFLARAAQSGIGLRSSTPAWADVPLADAAAVVAVLAVFALLVWIRPLAPAVERAPATAYAVQESKPELAMQTLPAGDESVHKVRPRQRRAASHRSGDAPPELPAKDSARADLWTYGMRPAQLAPVTYTPARSFTRVGDVAAFFGGKDVSKPEEQKFHLDLKLASLSFLDFPLKNDSEPNTVSPTFGIPVLHLNNNRIW